MDFAGGDLNLGSYVSQDPVNWVDSNGLEAILVIDRGLGIFEGFDDDGNHIRIPISEKPCNSISINDPFGTNGPLPLGAYVVKPRPANVSNPGRPNISTPGQDWNTVVTPNGTIRHGIAIHPGTYSEGCPLTRPGTNDYNDLLELINDEYEDGGVTLIVQDYY